MGLLLDDYMQWFHIGSYRLAGHFFSAGWVGASHWQAFTCGEVSDFQSMVHVQGNLPGSWKKCLWRTLGGCFRQQRVGHDRPVTGGTVQVRAIVVRGIRQCVHSSHRNCRNQCREADLQFPPKACCQWLLTSYIFRLVVLAI